MSPITDDIQQLIDLSHAIGADPAYAQGAGGNTSAKLNERVMAVKASGCTLKDMKREKGVACVDYPSIRGLIDTNRPESEFNASVNAALTDVPGIPVQRPSIETSLHAALKAKYVIHSHSVYANVVTCAADGRELAQKLFAQSAWVDYVTPGRDLVRAILKSSTDENIIFCANHGLIVTGATADDVLSLHKNVNAIIREALKLPAFDPNVARPDIAHMRQNVLFPDQIVYTLTDEFIDTPGARETLAAYAYIYNTLQAQGRPMAVIPPEKAQIIANLESEKYRQSMMKK